jgi:hypothetical protein
MASPDISSKTNITSFLIDGKTVRNPGQLNVTIRLLSFFRQAIYQSMHLINFKLNDFYLLPKNVFNDPKTFNILKVSILLSKSLSLVLFVVDSLWNVLRTVSVVVRNA